MDTPATVLSKISKLTARERRLISSYHGGATTMQPEPDKLAALIGTVRALDAAGVPYALIGGLAVGIHAAVPRATIDVDVALHLPLVGIRYIAQEKLDIRPGHGVACSCAETDPPRHAAS